MIKYTSNGFAEDCVFLKSGTRKFHCQALSVFYNDVDEDPDVHNCLGCVFFKTADQLKADREKSIVRLKNLRKKDFYD